MKRFILSVLMLALLATAAAAQPIPPAARSHYQAARTALQENDLNKALEEIDATIAVVPQSYPPYFLRGHIDMARTEFGKAEADFTKVISLKPTSRGPTSCAAGSSSFRTGWTRPSPISTGPCPWTPTIRTPCSPGPLPITSNKNTSRPGSTRNGPRS